VQKENLKEEENLILTVKYSGKNK